MWKHVWHNFAVHSTLADLPARWFCGPSVLVPRIFIYIWGWLRKIDFHLYWTFPWCSFGVLDHFIDLLLCKIEFHFFVTFLTKSLLYLFLVVWVKFKQSKGGNQWIWNEQFVDRQTPSWWGCHWSKWCLNTPKLCPLKMSKIKYDLAFAQAFRNILG